MIENEHGRIDLLSKEQIDWCDEYCNFIWFVKDDGKVYSKNDDIRFKNKETLISFFVKFGDCKYFDCSLCKLLKFLEGTSKRVERFFDCSCCSSLRSLEEAPKNVGGFFNCSDCDLLVSLEGAPKSIAGNFFCSCCKSLESIDELKNTKIEGRIFYYNCPKLEKYDVILKDINVFRRWQKSEYTADEFLKEYDGFFQAKKYGI